jgi:hypothetical protein
MIGSRKPACAENICGQHIERNRMCDVIGMCATVPQVQFKRISARQQWDSRQPALNGSVRRGQRTTRSGHLAIDEKNANAIQRVHHDSEARVAQWHFAFV